MDKQLEYNRFLAGDNRIFPTICDIQILCELDQQMPEGFGLFDFQPFPNILRWMGDLRTLLPGYEKNFQPVMEIANKMQLKK